MANRISARINKRKIHDNSTLKILCKLCLLPLRILSAFCCVSNTSALSKRRPAIQNTNKFIIFAQCQNSPQWFRLQSCTKNSKKTKNCGCREIQTFKPKYALPLIWKKNMLISKSVLSNDFRLAGQDGEKFPKALAQTVWFTILTAKLSPTAPG